MSVAVQGVGSVLEGGGGAAVTVTVTDWVALLLALVQVRV